jgi:hypothetical protein
MRGTLTIGPVITVIGDTPARSTVEDGVDVLDGPPPKAGGTPWMQRAAGRSTDRRVTRTEVGNVPQFEGRTCCYAHLYPLAGRVDLEIPFETRCPECGRTFRVTLGLVDSPRR